MRGLGEYLAARQQAFASHPLFRWLETTHDRGAVAQTFAQLAFWVTTYPDVLALNEARMVDARLRELAWQHRRDKLGHDRWYLDDLRRLHVAPARSRASIREAVHEMMSEVLGASSDAARFTLLLALESAHHVFLEATADWAERADVALEYFSHFNVEIERECDLFDHELDLSPEQLAECMAVVDRTYATFGLIFDPLLRRDTRGPAILQMSA